MKQKKNIAIISISLMAISMLTVACVGSFSILWIQQNISEVAQKTVVLEKKHEVLLRKLDSLNRRIAEYHQPIFMQGKVSGRLIPAQKKQIVWVDESSPKALNAYADSQLNSNDYLENNL
tara:strand:+ start:197 stop:556 length:360 start_codon:yes stop_codon:yes gene_type:complete